LSVPCNIGGFSGYSVSSTNKTDRHDITEILLKVALNTINQPTILILVSIADLGGPLVYSPVRLCLYFSVGVSEWLLFSAKWAIFHLYSGNKKLLSMKWWWWQLNWILNVLHVAHWNNSMVVDMSLHSDRI